ncbi:MAG: DMT family transporter [Deltaproteobacteria bacterium]|nr:MAG: DMT family transporter [Deltaproteobacteria bacterium]
MELLVFFDARVKGTPVSRTIYKADSLLMLTAVIWGGAFVAQRVGMDHVGPLTFNGVRFALGALTLLPLVVQSDRMPEVPLARRLGGRQAILGGGLAGMVLFAGATLQQVGLVYTTAGKAGFITGLYVVIVPLLGMLWKQRPGRGGWAGAVLAAIGLYFLSVTEEFTLAPGDAWELAGAFMWATHVLILGWLSPRVDVMKLACAQYVVCCCLSLTVAGFTETITANGLRAATIPILYGGVMSVGVAYTLQVVAQRVAPPTHAAIILSLEAVFAALAGWLILGEVLTLRGVVGCGLMLAGMLVAQLWP